MFNARQTSGSAPTRYKYAVEAFYGVDTVSPDGEVAAGRARDMRNFVRGKIGQLVKRGGITKQNAFDLYGMPKADRITKIDRFGELKLATVEGKRNWYIIPPEGGVKVKYDGSTIPADEKEPKEPLKDTVSLTALLLKFYMTSVTGVAIKDESRYTVKAINTFTACGKYYVLAKVKDAANNYDENELVIVRLAWDVDPSAGSRTLIIRCIMNMQRHAPEQMKEEEPVIPIPIIVKGASPKGGGVSNQAPNMLTPLVTESFCVSTDDLDANTKTCNRFQLSLTKQSFVDVGNNHATLRGGAWMDQHYDGEPETASSKIFFDPDDDTKLTAIGARILQDSVKIEVLTTDKTGNAKWKTLDNAAIFQEGKHDFLNPMNGGLWIPDAKIGASPVRGEDNVRITYIRDLTSFNHDDIWSIFYNDLQIGYGVGGYGDRLFTLDKGNKIYYSEMDEPLMIGELSYVQPGEEGAQIEVLGAAGNYLYAVDKQGKTYVIAGTVPEDNEDAFLADAAFLIADRVQGAPPVKRGVAVPFGEEFVYLSKEGLTAIYHDNIYDTRHAQCRSRMLDGAWKDVDLSKAVVAQQGDFLWIAAGKEIFVLDEKQSSTHKQYPYSGRQYEAYIFDFAEGFFETDEPFTFGREEDGAAYLYDGVHEYRYDPAAAVDRADGTEFIIRAYWQTAPITQYDFFKRKDSVRVALAVGNVGDMFALQYKRDDGAWYELEPYTGRFLRFSYGEMDYRYFTYRGKVEKLFFIKDRRRMKRYVKLSFRIENAMQYGLTLCAFGLQYTEEVV